MRSGFLALIGGLLLVACKKDKDDDGFKAKEDCNDSDAEINPAQAELCDGIDNDCDGDVDEGLLLTWYADTDADGFGDGASPAESCTQPSGYVDNSDDCDDSSALFFPGAPEDDCFDPSDYNCDGATGYTDSDEDGVAACEGDCNDENPDINPGAQEVCDGQDNNCDGYADLQAVDAPTWYLDHDGDTYGDLGFPLTLCDQPPYYVENSDDCNDLSAAAYPGAQEVCDLVDNDCDGTSDEPDAPDAQIWYADTDADGYGNMDETTLACPDALEQGPSGYVADDNDCDDTDAEVNPSAIEYCNDKDDNCNSIIDTDSADTVLWYLDSDGDGYGVGTSILDSCTQPTGYVLNVLDCNDGVAAINPGATEICDGIDNDCDNLADDDDSSLDPTTSKTFYADTDADDYGDVGSSLSACFLPDGYVSNSTDCDDTDEDVNPDEVEVCDDSKDNNCDGDASSCSLTLSSGSAVSVYGEVSDEGGFSLSHADVNDDGTEDILIGAPSQSNGGSSINDGAAFVFYGPISGSLDLSDADVTLSGRSSQKDTFGNRVRGLSDFDSDGSPDFAVAASQMDSALSTANTTAGAVFIYSGASVVSASSSALTSSDADITLYGSGKQLYLGASLVAGDVDGDGVGDILTGASWAPNRTTREGVVYLVSGGLSAGSYDVSTVADASFTGEVADDKLGTSGTIAIAGDVNGDGSVDVLLGAYLHSSETGAAYLIAGPHSGSMTVASADAKLTPASSGDWAGRVVAAAGDANGDGYDDVYIASPREDSGAAEAGSVFLIYGVSSLGSLDGAVIDTVASAQVYGASSSDQLGTSLAADGDLDGDGSRDLLVGAIEAGNLGEGAAYFFYGPLSGARSADEADAIFVGANSSDEAGADVSFTGDIGGGSSGDGLLIDVAEDDTNPSGLSNAGAAYIVFGFGL